MAILSLVEKIGDDSYFKPIADRRGFQRGLAATFRDLADGGMEELPVKDGQKLIDLNSLYQAFRSMTGKEFYDNSQLLFRASAAVRNFPEAFGGKELILYGFYDFTAAQKKLVQACAANLEVAAFLPWRESPAFAYASPVLEWYKTLGFQVEVPRESIRKERSSVEILQQGLFGQRPGKVKAPDDHSVLFRSAPSEAQEIREMAREILRLAGKENIPFHEMVILFRNVDLYGPLIQQTCQRLRIPIYFQGGLPLARTQEGKSALFFLDLVGSNLKRRTVMEFLNFAPIAWGKFFKEQPSPTQWDLLSREAGILEGRKQWEEKLIALMSRRKEEELAEREEEATVFADEAQRFWGFLKELFSSLDRFPRKDTWRGMVSASLHFMESYFKKSENQEAIFDCLRELESLDTFGRDVEIRQFKEIFSAALEENTQQLGGFQKEGICVTDLMPARGLSFRVVFIPGLMERAFPAPARFGSIKSTRTGRSWMILPPGSFRKLKPKDSPELLCSGKLTDRKFSKI